MKKNSYKTSLPALFLVLVLFGCTFDLDVSETPQLTPVILDQENTDQLGFLALLKATENYTITEAELENIIFHVLNPSDDGRSIISGVKTTITGSRKFLISNRGLSDRSSYLRSIEAEQQPIDIFIYDTENIISGESGYVLASTDMRVGNILAVVEGGTLEDEPEWFSDIIFRGLANHIDNTMYIFDNINNEDIYELLKNLAPQAETSTFERSFGSQSGTSNGKGLTHYWYPNEPNVVSWSASWTDQRLATIIVNWHQSTPYNHLINSSGLNNRTGCGVTALAQLMTHHMKPARCTWNEMVPILNVNYFNRGYNWSAMRKNFTNITQNGALDTAVLNYEISRRTTTYDSNNISYTPRANVVKGLRAMGYTTPNDFSSFIFNTARNSIINNRPVIVQGYSADGSKMHYWLIDGTQKMTYTEVLANGNTYHYTNRDFVRCNLGWNNWKSGWYLSTLFHFNNNYVPHINPRSTNANNEADYYNNSVRMLPNVY